MTDIIAIAIGSACAGLFVGFLSGVGMMCAFNLAKRTDERTARIVRDEMMARHNAMMEASE